MTDLEKHYMALSEVYLSAYQDSVSHNFKIMQAMGVIVEIESDLVFFEKKKGVTDKSKAQQERIQVLKSAVDSFTIATERNLQFRMVTSRLYKDNEAQALKISQLEDEIIKLKKQLEF